MSQRYTGGYVSTAFNGLNTAPTTVEYLVVAGGGGGGSDGGGGGAGGLLTATGYAVTIGSSITVTVGAGGTGATTASTALSNLGGASTGKAIAMAIVFG